jgi:hypothetical protein
MIMSRSDHFKAWAGPYVSAMEDIVYHHMPEFIKHTPVPDRPAKVLALKQAGLTYYQTDFTKFESHFVRELMEACECRLYSYLLRDWTGWRTLVKACKGVNKMRTRQGVSVEILARRMSGDLWTSLGNGFTNLMLAKFIAHRKGGVVRGFVEGDDGLFASTVPLCKEDYKDLGFTIKVDQIADPCKGSFCGLIFSESGQIIRSPRKFLMNFGWTQSFITAGDEIMLQLLRAKALSSVYETPHCPIVGALARYALSRTRSVVPRFVEDGFHKCPDEFPIPDFSPSSDTRVLFHELFGVDLATQVALEECISRGDTATIAALLPSVGTSEADMDLSWYEKRYVIAT